MINWLTIVIGILALIAGYKLQQYANEQSEKRIIEALTAQIQALMNKRLTSEEQARWTALKETLKIITDKK